MIGRRGRTSGLAIPGLLAAAFGMVAVGLAAGGSTTAPTGQPGYDWQLVARATNGDVVMRVPLPESRFVLRYRNSVYGSVAEERFAIGPDGQMILVELAADEAAVLDEYYMADRPRPARAGDTRRWWAAPESPLAIEQLFVAATQHGQRSLVVENRTIPLWQVAAPGMPTLMLEVE